MYVIEMITSIAGKEKKDGRYPLRKGSVGNIYNLRVNERMMFDYIKDNKGNDKRGCLMTSEVKYFNEYSDGKELMVRTFNSVYYLKKLEEE